MVDHYSWTDARIEALKDGLRRGLSASEIAVEIGAPSRNSIISKANRCGLGNLRPQKADRPEPVTQRLRPKAFVPRVSVAPKPRSAPMMVAAPAPKPSTALVAIERHLPLLVLRGCDCRWPTKRDDEDEQWLFCAAPCLLEDSYCAAHKAASYAATPPRARKPVRNGFACMEAVAS